MASFEGVIVLALYFLQGGIQGLAFDVLPMYLQKHPEAEDIHLSHLALAEYPFTIKFLLAPLVDGFYWRRIGRRETWLIPTQFITAMGLLFLVFHAEELLARSRPIAAGQLTTWITMLTAMAAIGDIATDAWASGLLSDSSASVSQAVGLTAGMHCSSTVFYALSGRGYGGLPHLLFVFAITGFLVVAMFFVRLSWRNLQRCQAFAAAIPPSGEATRPTRPVVDQAQQPLECQQENKEEEREETTEDEEKEEGVGEEDEKAAEEVMGIAAVLRAVFSFLLLPNIRLYVGLQFFWGLHYGLASLLRVRFQQLGLTPELLADFDLYSLPFDVLTMVAAGRLASSAKPLSIMYRFRWLEVGLMLAAYFLYRFSLEHQPARVANDGSFIVVEPWLKWSYIGLTQIMGKVGTLVFVIKCSFHNNLGNKSPETSGTVITFLACCSNLSQAFPRTLAPVVSAKVGFDATVMFFLATAAAALMASAHPLRHLANPYDKGWTSAKED